MKRLHKRFLLATFCALFTATENIQIELRDDQDAALKNGDSKTVIVDEITRNAQFPLKARAITVNGNASQGTIEALINVIYTWQ
ncbi:hypothetical protein ABN298_21705 [Escherichia coli]|uniref:hypothetical protein n=1 Tax=Escherichia coli TaxID=562 RepID=UPI0032D9CACD